MTAFCHSSYIYLFVLFYHIAYKLSIDKIYKTIGEDYYKTHKKLLN